MWTPWRESAARTSLTCELGAEFAQQFVSVLPAQRRSDEGVPGNICFLDRGGGLQTVGACDVFDVDETVGGISEAQEREVVVQVGNCSGLSKTESSTLIVGHQDAVTMLGAGVRTPGSGLGGNPQHQARVDLVRAGQHGLVGLEDGLVLVGVAVELLGNL